MSDDPHEISRQRLAEKTPYTVGEVHDTIVMIKEPLLNALFIFSDTGKHSTLEKAKAIKAVYDIIPMVKKIPRPDRETCKYENSKILCDIRDEFEKRICMNQRRDTSLVGIINAGIIIYEYDKPYRHLMDWWLKEINFYVLAGTWLPLEAGKPSRWWKDRINEVPEHNNQ